MRELVELRSPEESMNFKKYVEKRLRTLKSRGYDGNAMRCWLIGYLFGGGSTEIDQQGVYTSRELKELFDMTF